MFNLQTIIERVSERIKDMKEGICIAIHNFDEKAWIETMEVPLSKEDIHYQTIIGIDRIPVVAITLHITKENVIQAVKTHKLDVDLHVGIAEECPEKYRPVLEKKLDTLWERKNKWN